MGLLDAILDLFTRVASHCGFPLSSKNTEKKEIGFTWMNVTLRDAVAIFWKSTTDSPLCKNKATILIVGMGFIGVEWATEIKHFFPKISITMCDMAPNCLGPL